MRKVLSVAVLSMAFGVGALAQSPEYMREYCANATQGFFQDYKANTT